MRQAAARKLDRPETGRCEAIVLDPRDAVPDYTLSLGIALNEGGTPAAVVGAPGLTPKAAWLGRGTSRFLYPYFPLRFAGGWRNLVPYATGWLRTILLLRQLRPRVLHIQWLVMPQFEAWLIPLVAKRFGCRLVYTAHNAVPHDRAAGLPGGYRKFYLKCDRVIVHAESARERLLNTVPELDSRKVAVIPHGNFDYFAAVPVSREEARTKWGAGSRPLIVFAGKLRPYKGLFVLLEAFERIGASRADLLIAGHADDASCHRDMLSFIADHSLRNVRIINKYLSDDELRSILIAADIAVLPYLEIDQSGIMLYAMTLGRPIAASRLPGFVEVLAGEQAAELFEPGDSEGLARGLSALLDDPGRREEIGARARMVAEARYAWPYIARQTRALYQNSHASGR